jgi:hypothetical protein
MASAGDRALDEPQNLGNVIEAERADFARRRKPGVSPESPLHDA